MTQHPCYKKQSLHLLFDGKNNPGKFIASYETTVYLAGGDIQTLAKSLILAVEDVAHD